MKYWWNHPWTVAVGNVLLLILIYSLSRLFFYWVNVDMFPNVSAAHLWEMMCGGMRFDWTAILYFSSIYLLLMLFPFPWKWRHNPIFLQATKWFLWVPNLIGIFCNAVDCVYVRFTDRRTTWSFFREFQHDDNLFQIFCTSVLQYWYVTLFFVTLMVLFVILTRQPQTDIADRRSPWVYYPSELAVCLVSAYFVVILIRGGFGGYTRPINMTNALQYTNQPRETQIVLNTPLGLMRSLGVRIFEPVHYYDDTELALRMSPIHESSLPCLQQRKNVMIIILESFSKEYIGFFNHHLSSDYEGYTPFLDSLLSESYTYTHSFASGRKSIDAMPSILSSIPMLIEPYFDTPYSTNDVSSLVYCLRSIGYHSAFFHGAPNGSMGFQAFARSAGFERYYGMDEYLAAGYPSAFDGTWALWDEDFLQYTAHTLDTLTEPFCSALFTASSHHPYRVPNIYEGVFPKGKAAIHPCVGYADYALRLFFEHARQQPWFERTLFVITADHTNELVWPSYQTDKGIFEVPILFYEPSCSLGYVDSTTVVSQTDIMPSVLAYLGYDEPFFAFGENALTQPKQHPYAICYNNPVYQIFSNQYLMQFDGEQIRGIYDYTSDPLLQNNRVDELRNMEAIQAMLSYLKAYIQQYVNRMIDNRLTISSCAH